MLDISFILLADGPHGSASLKPDHSHQWWARRDSLVRCSALAGSASVCILFSPQSSPGVYSALCMTGKLREEMPIPNERELLIRWKQATLLAEEGRAEKLLSVERTSNVVASMTPSLELARDLGGLGTCSWWCSQAGVHSGGLRSMRRELRPRL